MEDASVFAEPKTEHLNIEVELDCHLIHWNPIPLVYMHGLVTCMISPLSCYRFSCFC